MEGAASTTPPPSADPVPKDGQAPALHGNRRKSSATLGCSSCSHLQKWNSPPTPTANLSSLPAQGQGLSNRKRPLPLSGVQGDGRREQGWGTGHGRCPLQNLCPARPTAAHFLLLQGLPACCLFQGAFPDSTSPGTPSCILDLLSGQSQLLFRGPSRCWQPPLLPAPLCESKMSRRCTGKP